MNGMTGMAQTIGAYTNGIGFVSPSHNTFHFNDAFDETAAIARLSLSHAPEWAQLPLAIAGYHIDKDPLWLRARQMSAPCALRNATGSEGHYRVSVSQIQNMGDDQPNGIESPIPALARYPFFRCLRESPLLRDKLPDTPKFVELENPWDPP